MKVILRLKHPAMVGKNVKEDCPALGTKLEFSSGYCILQLDGVDTLTDAMRRGEYPCTLFEIVEEIEHPKRVTDLLSAGGKDGSLGDPADLWAPFKKAQATGFTAVKLKELVAAGEVRTKELAREGKTPLVLYHLGDLRKAKGEGK